MSSIMGSPLPMKVGRRMLLVSYVSIGEWETLGELVKVHEGKALLELLYFSLHRADASVKRRSVRWLARIHRKALTPLIELICKISLPKRSALEAAPGSAVATAKEVERNVKTQCRMLSRMHGWTPQQISDMSPAQVIAYLSGGEDGTGIQKMSGPQYRAFRMQRSLN